MKPKKCPLCHSLIDQFQEMWRDADIFFETDKDGYPNEQKGILEGRREPYAVYGICRECRYRWKLRGVTQITDLYKEATHA